MSVPRRGARALSAVGIASATGLLLYAFLSAESERTVGLVIAGAVVAVAGGLRSRVLPRLVEAAGPTALFAGLGAAALVLIGAVP